MAQKLPEDYMYARLQYVMWNKPLIYQQEKRTYYPTMLWK